MGRAARQEGHPERQKPCFKNHVMSLQRMALSPWQPLSGRRVRGISRLNERADESGAGGVIRVCTINVGTLVGRGRELVAMLTKRKIDMCCIQEVRYRNQGCTTIGEGDDKFKLWYSGGQEKKNGVGILMRADMSDNVIEVHRYDDRMMRIKLVIGKKVWNVFSIYAPQTGRPDQEKIDFWESFEDEVGRIPESEILLIGGDVNGHVGRDNGGYEDVMGKYGYGSRNSEGETVLDVCKNHNLKILNTYFEKEDQKLITYKSGDISTQIDLLLLRKVRSVNYTDCHAIAGEDCLTVHRPVRAKLFVSGLEKQKPHSKRKVKLWKLDDPEKRRECQERFRINMEGYGGDMERLERNVLEVCKEVCGETSGRRGRERETWWWSEAVQNILREKKAAFKRWQRTGEREDREAYRRKRNEAKRVVKNAKNQAWRRWSEDLNTREGQNKMFRVAAQMKKDKADVAGSRFVKNVDGRLLIEPDAVASRWKEYFSRLLNEENENQIEMSNIVSGPIEDIKREEVEVAVSKMKNRRATGPSGVAVEMFKGMEEVGIDEMTEALRSIERNGRMPSNWKDSTTIVLYKGKGDALDCARYRGLRLLEHGFKTYEKVLERKLRMITRVGENQFGFTAEKSTIGAIFLVRQLQEKYLAKKRKLFHIFVDMEKAFDRIPRKAIEWALRRQLVPELLVQRVMLLYEDSRTRVRVAGVESECFDINVGVHQGSALSPLLFIIIMEEATKECQDDTFWNLLYADDLVLSAGSREEVVQKFIDWKSSLERRGMKVNIGKTKLMVTGKKSEIIRSGRYPCGVCGRGVGANSILCTSCQYWCHGRCSGLRVVRVDPNFRCPACTGQVMREEADDDALQIDGEVVEEVREFCYLGDLLDTEGSVERTVRMRVAAAWRKWREISSLLLNKAIPLKYRGRVYDACVRSVLLYGAEGWAMTDHVQSIVTGCDRRLLRYMAGVSLRDRVRSEEVASRCCVDEVEIVMRERRLRWFGHVRRRDEDDPIRSVMDLEVDGGRPRGRPKKTWKKTVEEDMRRVGVREEHALDRGRWRAMTKRRTPVQRNRRR